MIATSEKGLSVLDAVAMYKELTEVESGFRQLKDVMAMRPIYHQIEIAGEGAHLRGGVGVAGATTCWAAGSKRREWICRRRGRCKRCRPCGW